MTALRCVTCDSTDLTFLYVLGSYRCGDCGARMYDANEPPRFEAVTRERALRKRPAIYGLPVCLCCSHAPHDGTVCEFCQRERDRTDPPPIKLVLGVR